MLLHEGLTNLHSQKKASFAFWREFRFKTEDSHDPTLLHDVAKLSYVSVVLIAAPLTAEIKPSTFQTQD